MTSPIQLKLFMGYCHTSTLQTHLYQSPTWKEAYVTPGNLKETTWQGKLYIGLYIPLPLSLQEVWLNAQSIKTKLQVHCLSLDLDTQPFYIFHEAFIS